MDRIIEEESGTYRPRGVHLHNGYYAGDFSSVPFKQPDLRTLELTGCHGHSISAGTVMPQPLASFRFSNAAELIWPMAECRRREL